MEVDGAVDYLVFLPQPEPGPGQVVADHGLALAPLAYFQPPMMVQAGLALPVPGLLQPQEMGQALFGFTAPAHHDEDLSDEDDDDDEPAGAGNVFPPSIFFFFFFLTDFVSSSCSSSSRCRLFR